MQQYTDKKNTFFATFTQLDNIIVPQQELIRNPQILYVWAMFNFQLPKDKIDEIPRFKLSLNYPFKVQKTVEIRRIPCVKYYYNKQFQSLDLIGVELFRSFSDYNELDSWRQQQTHTFVVKPQNLRLINDQEVKLRLIMFNKNDFQFCAMSFAGIDDNVIVN